MAVAQRYIPETTTESSIYQSRGAAPRLAEAISSHFQMVYFNPRDSMQELEPKIAWGSAFADDLAIRKLLLEDILDASRLLHLAQRESRSAEPNRDRELIIDNIDQVMEILKESLPQLNNLRRERKLPSLETYLR